MKVNRFVSLICLLAIFAAVLLWWQAPPASDWSIGTITTLAALAITAELMGFLLPRGAAGSISFIPYMTSVLLVPNFAALAAIPAVRLIAEIAKKREPRKAIFNVAQLTLA